MNTATKRPDDDPPVPGARIPSPGSGSEHTGIDTAVSIARLTDRLPKQCGLCRTLDESINPNAEAACLACRDAGEHVNWLDIDSIEALCDSAGWPR